MPAIRILVTGRVQGVGFRYFVREIAESMGAVGEVWNRSDGAVEVIAQHPDEKVIDALAETLEAGPGRVAAIKSEATAEGDYAAFEIGATR